MQRVDHMIDELGPDWEEDTIYCEATCQPEDILYEGSDDDDYDSPSTRRLRYEAAGQRFLDGVEPFLLTAQLRGPFDKGSGWVNPWRSKHRTVRATQEIAKSPAKQVQQRKRKRVVSIPETTQAETQDSLECHLPSPESLKQPSVADLHPFLEEDELVMVQNWRSSVEPTALTKDSFWASTPQGDQSTRRRRARGSGWLRKLATKRRRTEIMEMGSVNTPLPRRSDTDIIQPSLSTELSFSSSSQLPSSALRSTPQRQFSKPRSRSQEPDDEDELVSTVSDAAVDASASVRRVSPRRDVQPNYDSAGHDYEDELSQEQLAAAATLSSPVSQRTCPPSSSRRSPLKAQLSREARQSQTPSKRRRPTSCPIPPDTERKADMVQQNQASAHEDGEDEDEDNVFETQEDQSFCFKMRQKTVVEVASSPAVLRVQEPPEAEPALEEEETWAGFSSEDEGFPSLSSIASSEVSNKSTPVVLTVALDTSQGTEDSENEDASSSGLSSILSQYFDGFDSTVLASQDALEMRGETEGKAAEVIEVAAVQKKDKLKVQVEKPSPATSQKVGKSMPTGPSESRDGAREGEESDEPMELDQQIEDDTLDAGDDSLTSMEDEDLEDLALKPLVNSASRTPKDVKVNNFTPSFSGALLLKASVRRSLPTNWSRVSQLRSVSTSSSLAVVTTHTAEAKRHSDEVSTASEEDSEDDDSIESESEAESPAESGSEFEPGPVSQSRGTILDAGSPSEALSKTVDSLVHHETTLDRALKQVQADQESAQQVTVEEGQHNDTRDIDSQMEVNNPKSQPLSTSQQSPWAGNQLSQYAAMAIFHLSQEETATNPALTPRKTDSSLETTAHEAQTPWTDEVKLSKKREAVTPNLMKAAQDMPMQEPSGFIDTPVMSLPTRNQNISATPDIAPRLSTPEPQFSVKSFASFMSPSPEQRPRRLPRASWRDSGSGLPSTQGILASAMKNPWSTKSDRRVSWASLPGEDDHPFTPAVAETLPPLSQPRSRASSPPPLVPIADLPTSDDAKFHEHFKVMIRRTQDRRQNILPTESQRTVGSPSPLGMAKKFIEVDEVLQPDEEDKHDTAESLPVLKPTEKLQDNVDFVENVFREMSDYLETWNVDTELEQARKEDSTETPRPRIDVSAQSPW